MSLRNWHPGKIGMLWGLSAAVLITLLFAFESLGKLVALTVWLLLTAPILIVTWLWLSAREQSGAVAQVAGSVSGAAVDGSVASTAQLERVGAFQRLRTHAPQKERAGYIVIAIEIAFFLVGIAAAVVEGIIDGRVGLGGRLFFVCVIALGCVLTFAWARRPRWGYYTIFAAVWLMWVAYVWGAAVEPAGVNSAAAGAKTWAAVFTMLGVVYVYRRRWWFGIDVPIEKPSKSPEGGKIVLFLIALIATFIAETFVAVGWRQ